ncbi:hypothetical protein Pcinc_000029 [Petrolisthes cinctipes]|uniref:Uncharacterized protein n=1 Tax=Petrolisthes cinctipes TaxID=88211 RepID=A0AAE1GQA4_PETCI|nr:hypothetical protein Pcinc_000029 [Petrolisthes cinctipes]
MSLQEGRQYDKSSSCLRGDVTLPGHQEIIRRAHDIGLHVSSITSDMGSANQALWKSFRVVVSSHSVSCGVRFLVEHEGRDKSYLTTAWFLEFVNKWFNLMSSRHPVMALSKCNRDVYQESVAHLESAVWVFENIAIGKGQWKPVQTGVILATLSVLELHVELLSMGHGYVLTSRFTQDRLDNLFGCMRMKNPVPSCLEFRQALKINTVAQFFKCPAHGR